MKWGLLITITCRWSQSVKVLTNYILRARSRDWLQRSRDQLMREIFSANISSHIPNCHVTGFYVFDSKLSQYSLLLIYTRWIRTDLWLKSQTYHRYQNSRVKSWTSFSYYFCRSEVTCIIETSLNRMSDTEIDNSLVNSRLEFGEVAREINGINRFANATGQIFWRFHDLRRKLKSKQASRRLKETTFSRGRCSTSGSELLSDTILFVTANSSSKNCRNTFLSRIAHFDTKCKTARSFSIWSSLTRNNQYRKCECKSIRNQRRFCCL